MVPSQRRALRARVLFFRLLDRINSRLISPRAHWENDEQSHGRGDPGQPCRASTELADNAGDSVPNAGHR